MKTFKLRRIAVVCYGEIEYWNSRKLAMQFYREAMEACDGCERERYTNIFLDLLDGMDICTDGMGDYDQALQEGRIGQYDTPCNTRDYRGKIYYTK